MGETLRAWLAPAMEQSSVADAATDSALDLDTTPVVGEALDMGIAGRPCASDQEGSIPAAQPSPPSPEPGGSQDSSSDVDIVVTSR